MEQLFYTLQDLAIVLSYLTLDVFTLLLSWSLLIVWVAWWLFAVNWSNTWPVLRQGAWVPFVLLCVMGALVWSRLEPTSCSCLRFVTVPNFWWQLGSVGLLVGLTLFCGWLQTYFGWTPPVINVEPTPHGDHDDAHGHGHDDHHAAPAVSHGSHAHH